nr:MAG TPA: hypothetical protein [Caudoviricetes sp.]
MRGLSCLASKASLLSMITRSAEILKLIPRFVLAVVDVDVD